MSAVIYSESDEKAVLGCLIGDADALKKHLDSLRETDFFVPAHKRLFREICALHDAGEIVRAEKFRDDSFALICECMNAGTLPLVDQYLRIVKRDSARRVRLEELEIERGRIVDDPLFFAPETEKLVARDAVDLAQDESIVEPPVLVAGMLHKGSALLLGGSSKSFKSWSLIDLSLSVANGAPWWSLPCEKGKVLFVDFELTPHFWRKRVLEISRARNLDLNGIRIMNCRGHSPEDALRAIDSESKAQSFDLICIDPLYSFLAGKDENSAGDVGAVMRRLAMLSESTGAALAISHHFSKGNQAAKDSIDRFSGSGVFARFPDALLTMTRHEEDGAFTVDPTVRNFAPMNPFVLKWEHPVMYRDHTLDPANVKKVGGRPETNSKEELLALVPKPVSYSDWFHAAESIGFSKTSFNRKRTELLNAGLITQTPGTRLWVKVGAK